MKLVVFDFDSTLMDGETIDFLAKEVGVYEEVAKITNLAMNGELNFFESLKKRASLLKGLKEQTVDDICKNLPLMKGASQTIKELKKKDYKIVCLSGGFSNATSHAQDVLGLDANFSNYLYSKDGILTGDVGGAMMFEDSKKQIVLKLQQLLNISKENTIAIGDGANDLSMFEVSKIKIAFCAKQVLRDASDIQINEKDLTQILEYL